MKVIQIGNVARHRTRKNPNQYRVYDVRGIAPCLNAMTGGGRQPLVLVRNGTKEGAINCKVGGVMSIAYPSSNTRRGRVIDGGETSPTLDTGCTTGKIEDEYHIRKLTPKECFRLQGIPDEMYERAAFVNSDSQLYKQAGNACTTNVIRDIGERMK